MTVTYSTVSQIPFAFKNTHKKKDKIDRETFVCLFCLFVLFVVLNTTSVLIIISTSLQIVPNILMDFEKPGEYIVGVAKKERATVIIMGTRGMGKIRRTILGSVSDYVISHADCPVLVCRTPKD